MEKAFAAGYDPALELATHSIKQQQALEEELDELTFDNDGIQQPTSSSGHLRRREQDWIDRIVHGAETGHYYVLLGPKVKTVSFCRYLADYMYFRALERRP
jgi:hypothetical protein